jgi:phosphoserine aminotransferase
MVLAAMASLNSGRPPTALYLCIAGSEHAAMAASTMCCGVAKSGSPAPKPMTFSPAARMALALLETARVAEGAMAPTRREIRSRLMVERLPRSLDENSVAIGAVLASTADTLCDRASEHARHHHPGRPPPADGRFGSGPTKVRPRGPRCPGRPRYRLHGHVASSDARQADGRRTAQRHRRTAPRTRRLRDRLRQRRLHRLLGRCRVLTDRAPKSHHLASASSGASSPRPWPMAPHLQDPSVAESAMGTRPGARAVAGVDAILLHPQRDLDRRHAGPGPRRASTTRSCSSTRRRRAGGLMFDAAATDVYYFSLQKALRRRRWLLDRDGVAGSDRADRDASRLPVATCPPFARPPDGVENSRKDQTYNTPALATVFLAAQVESMLVQRQRRPVVVGRQRRPSRPILYGWADAIRRHGRCRSCRSRQRSQGRRDDRLRRVDRRRHARTRPSRNGIVDTDGYRKLGRNQLRIGMFPAIDAGRHSRPSRPASTTASRR